MLILYKPNELSQQRQHEKKRWIYPVLLAMQAERYRRLGHEVVWDAPVSRTPDRVITEPEPIDFLTLPPPDRIFTDAFNKKYQNNGNFKYRPGTYIQAANGCWHGKCSFCVERNVEWKVRSLPSYWMELREIEHLGFKEVFDDSGTFPVGKWLDDLLDLPKPGIPIGCNMRMVDVDYKKMKDWGFRMLLFGIESANQETLDRINKGVNCEDIKWIEKASKAGLECHGAFMFGYPFENHSDAQRTLNLARKLLTTGVLKTAQASLYSVSGHKPDEDYRKYIRGMYGVASSPRFWIAKAKDLKTLEDWIYLGRSIKEGLKSIGGCRD